MEAKLSGAGLDDRGGPADGPRDLSGWTGHNPHAFVVGCPRSGTTMFQRMLSMHPRLATLPEVRWLATAPADPGSVDADGCVTPQFLRRLVDRPALGRYARLPVPTQEIAELLSSGARVRYDVFTGWLFDRYGAAQGRPLVVNKTVDNALYVDALARTWPDARIVHLVRDGRDVAMSANGWRRAPRLAETFPTWSVEPMATAALWWEWHVRRAREAGCRLGTDRYLEVRYEQLVRWPEATLSVVCAFLGVDYDPAMCRFHDGREVNTPGVDAKHAWRPVTVGLRDWRTQMTESDQGRFEAVAGDLLQELCYSPADIQVSAHAARTADMVRAAFAAEPLPARWGRTRHLGERTRVSRSPGGPNS
jgi:hypothetical protein